MIKNKCPYCNNEVMLTNYQRKDVEDIGGYTFCTTCKKCGSKINVNAIREVKIINIDKFSL